MSSVLSVSQYEVIKNDRLASISPSGDMSKAVFEDEELRELERLVDSAYSTGKVDVTEVLMCAKCIGECKIF